MKQEPLVIERTLNAAIEKVWQAITGKDQMKQWYFDLLILSQNQVLNFNL